MVIPKLSMGYVSIILVAMASASQMYAHLGCAIETQSHARYDATSVGDAAQKSSVDKAKKAAKLALRIGYNAGKASGIWFIGNELRDSDGTSNREGVIPNGLLIASMCYLIKSIYDDIVPSRQKIDQKSSGFKKVVNVLGNTVSMWPTIFACAYAIGSKNYGWAGVFAVSTIALGENIYKIVKQHRAEKAGSVPEVVTEAA